MPTIEEVKEFFKTDDGQTLLSSLIETEVKGLKSKRDELIDKLKKEKETKSEFASRLEALEEEKEAAELKAAEKSGDVAKITAQLEKDFKKREEKLTIEKEELSRKLNKHVVGEGLTQALIKANVETNLMPAAKALIETTFKGEIGDNDGSPFAKFDGKAVDEFVAEWAQSETGKHFVSASNNSGGGSNGANGTGKVKTGTDQPTMTRSEFDDLSPMQQSKISIEGVTLVDD